MQNLVQFVLPAVGLVVSLVVLFLIKKVLSLRRVVSTNEVHIVQTAKHTTSYGKDTVNGNSYYEWPSWLPLVGVTKIVLPVSVFDLDLTAYEAYDQGRLPFVVDVKAFFRIKDSNVAAQRVASFDELLNQLKAIVQGAVRVVLASNGIEEIMQGRSKFGDEFTKEVNGQLSNWGVETVKNIELMDLRDGKDSHVIKAIMEKKKSHIDMESRTEVAKNTQAAKIAEINAQQAVDLQAQQAKQAVGLRTIEAERQVELQGQEKIQVIKEQEKLTKEKEMAIRQVEALRAAEIEKGVQLVKAQQQRETQVLVAQGQKDTTVLAAEGQLESKRREAEGIQLEGTARAEAEKAFQLAPVEAQIVLAKEIGGNESYQQYLITVRKVEAEQAIGIEQAKALAKAEVKVIANTSNGPAASLNSVGELFSAKGGAQLGAMLEGLAQTEAGASAMKTLGLTQPNPFPKK
jgi:flotillin